MSDTATIRSINWKSNSLSCQSSIPVLNIASLSSTTAYATAGQCTTSVVDCYDQWDSDAAFRQSPVLSEEGHFVFIPRKALGTHQHHHGVPDIGKRLWQTPISGTPLSVSTDRTLIYNVDEYLRPSLAGNHSSVGRGAPT